MICPNFQKQRKSIPISHINRKGYGGCQKQEIITMFHNGIKGAF